MPIAELTFESPGGYATSIPEFTDIVYPPTSIDGRDYFIKTDGSNIRAVDFFNVQGNYYFTAQDIGGEGAANTQTLKINNVNISGYSNLEFRVHLAEDDAPNGTSEDWDTADYVHFNYDIDNSGTFTDLLWVEATGGNTEPQIDTDFDGVGDGTAITSTFTEFKRSIGSSGDLLDIEIIFRLNSNGDDIAIDNIEIWGDPVPCVGTVTWDGTDWSNGTGPDLFTSAELNADYDTASYGEFSACSLTLTDAELTIDNNTFVEVQNDLNVDAGSSIIIRPSGAFIQKNDLSAVTNNGTLSVEKETAKMTMSDEYTFWSSPVSNETFISGVPNLNPNKCYIFMGQNFLDATAETGNNNAEEEGQDDIDDNGNDWQQIGSSTIMSPGVGYATTISDFAFAIAPGTDKRFKASFEGDFNNGIYRVLIYRNDSELNDYNWNFIGNPYPSAIDADLFLETNSNVSTDIAGSGYIDGAIFIWSQDTPPLPTNNGNQQLNFSNDDYAIINATGETPGGDGETPSRYIPSGQGFFVSMSNTAAAEWDSGDIYKTNIVFSNAMRVADVSANNKFFKGHKKKSNAVFNKLWFELTSDNGVFNQILVGYVNGASVKDDGLAYDVPKYPTKGAALYSIIEDSNKKYAIQGKPRNNINEDESIKLGFKTTINVATLYTLSIAKMEGDFLNSHSVFLKDNLLNKVHDLSVCDYTFTSDTGEFNSRFEIVFKADALSTNADLANPSQLKIVELENDKVQFTAPNGLSIQTVSVFDLFGRQLYQLTGQNNFEIYKLSNLKGAVYIARVKLSNGAVISKKAIKK